MGRKKNDILEYVDKMVEKEKLIEYKKSRGTIIMKNGFIFQLPNLFNFFRDSWLAYTSAELELDDEKRLSLLKMSNNGVLTNGAFSVDLNDVSLMISEHQDNSFNLGIDDELMENELIDDELMDDEFTDGDSINDMFGFN